MSLRYALVGLLAEEPMSGYDLTQRFAVSLANVWPAHHPQIYAELARLDERGWIQRCGAGPRGRKVYSATASGVDALQTWLRTTEPDRALRHEPILRAFFSWLLDPADAVDQFRRDADAYSVKLAELERLAADVDWVADAAGKSGRVALEAGLRLYSVLRDWASWAAEQAGHEHIGPAAPIDFPGVDGRSRVGTDDDGVS